MVITPPISGGSQKLATQPPDPDAICRRRLNGRRVAFKDMAREAVRLRMGDRLRGKPPLSIRGIADRLGYSQPKSVYDLLDWAKKWGIADALEKPHIPHPAQYSFDIEMADFVGDPLVEKWIREMSTRGHSGKPLKTIKSLVRGFEIVCKTTKSPPAQWLAGDDRDAVIEFARNTMAAFVEEYKAGRAALKYPKGWTLAKADIPAITFSYAKSVRNFLLTHGYNMPRGERSTLAASVVPFHGLFNEVRLSEEQFRHAKDWLADKYGIDSDVYRWFCVGIEGLPRARALHGMRVDYEEVKTGGGTIWVMTAKETKTEHYNQGKWPKYIHGKRTREAIGAVIKRGGQHVIEQQDFKRAKNDIYPKLRAVYHELGVDAKHLTRDNDPTSGYFMKKPTHALRHCGAQRWLRLTNWNIEFVASMGWRSPTELTQSYGAMPAEAKFELLGGLKLG